MPYAALNDRGRYELDDLESLLIWPGDLPVRVPDVARKCAVFLGNKDDEGRFHPRATGFAVAFEEYGLRYTYLATAQHNIVRFKQKEWDICLRTNSKDGRPQDDRIDALKWWVHPENATDVAVIPVIFRETEDWSFVPLNGSGGMSGTAEILKDHHLGLGDEIFITGLFRNHAGRDRNSPIIRIGNIAMMKEAIETKWYGLTEAYLIKARSTGGPIKRVTGIRSCSSFSGN